MNHPLYELKLKLISACDYRCQMCGHWQEPVTRLTTPEALAAVRDAAALGARSVIFSGGEPTLHKGLEAAVRLAASLGLRVTLATNGGGLAPGKLEALIDAGVAQFNVSVDSPDAAVHDHIRGVPGSFERIVDGLGRAARLGRKVAVKTVVSRDGYRSLSDMPALADRAPIHSLSFTMVTANESAMAPLLLHPAEVEAYFFEILPAVLEGAAARKLPVKLFPVFRALMGQRPAALAKALRAARREDFADELRAFSLGRYGEAFAGREPCPVLRGKALVRPDGGVYFCCEVSHTGDLCMGQLKAQRAQMRANQNDSVFLDLPSSAPSRTRWQNRSGAQRYLEVVDQSGDARLGDGLPRGLDATWRGPGYVSLRARAPTPVHEKCWTCTEWYSRPPEALLKVERPSPAAANSAGDEPRPPTLAAEPPP